MRAKHVITIFICLLVFGAGIYYTISRKKEPGFLTKYPDVTRKVDAEGRYVPPLAKQKLHCTTSNGLPDPDCTPGAINVAVTQANIQSTICSKGYTKKIRPGVSYTNALKRRQMQQYGFSGPLSDYEEDHQIPLELGGDPVSPANLWPEPHAPYPGSFDKDHVENYLRQLVCAGKVSLGDAQQMIATNWLAVYNAATPEVVNY